MPKRLKSWIVIRVWFEFSLKWSITFKTLNYTYSQLKKVQKHLLQVWNASKQLSSKNFKWVKTKTWIFKKKVRWKKLEYIFQIINFFKNSPVFGYFSLSKLLISFQQLPPLDTRHKLIVHKTFRRRPRRLLYALFTFSLGPISRG